jgi:hypothetical protein
MIRTLLTALITAVVVATGCGGKVVAEEDLEDATSSASTQSTTGGTPGSNGSSGSGGYEAFLSDCATVCDRFEMLGCDLDQDCTASCSDSYASAGGCLAELVTYISCTADNVNQLSCSVLPAACDASYGPYATCLAN